LPVITPAPTRDVEEEEEEEEEEEDSDYSEGDYPTQTGNATLGPPSGFPELDEGYVIAGGNGLSRGAIAGGVIGTHIPEYMQEKLNNIYPEYRCPSFHTPPRSTFHLPPPHSAEIRRGEI